MNKKISRWLLVIGFAMAIPLILINVPFPTQITDDKGVLNTDVPISAQFSKVTLPTTGSVNDVLISGKYAVIVEGSAGVRVINISNMNSVQDVDTLLTIGNAISIEIEGTLLFVCTSDNGLRIVNFTDPTDLSEIGSISSTASHLKVKISGHYAYSVANDDGLRVTNISNPASPNEVSDLSISSAKSLAIAGNYVYIAAGTNGVKVVDISNSLSPNLVKTIPASNAKDVLIDGDRLFIADASGLICANIANPLNPVIISSTITTNTGGFTGIDLFGVFLYATGVEKTEIFNLTNWLSPKCEPYTLPGGEKITLVGFHAYIAQKTSGLTIVEVAKPFTPSNSYIPAYHYKVSGSPYDLDIRGDLAFITTKRMGVRIWNISTLTEIPSWNYTGGDFSNVDQNAFTFGDFALTFKNATEFGRWKGAYDLYDTQFDGSLAYIATRGFGLRIVNFSDVNDPKEIGSFKIDPFDMETNNSFSVVRVIGDVAIIGTGPENHIPEILTVNITDPTNPTLLGRYSFPISSWDPTIFKNHIMDMEINGNILYVLMRGDKEGGFLSVSTFNRFTIFNISDPSSIVKLDEIISPGMPHALTLYGHYAYYSYSYIDWEAEGAPAYYIIKVVDVQNPALPNEIQNMSSGTGEYMSMADEPVAKDLRIEGNRMYAGMKFYIKVYDLTNPAAPSEIQKITAYKAGNIIIRGNWLYYTQTDAYELNPADKAFVCVKLKDGTSLDVDGDGLSYFQELHLGTLSTNLDTDGDGMSDDIEFRYGFNPLEKDDHLDADGDGLSNAEEIKLGTDPTKKDTDGDGFSDSIDPDPLNSAVMPSTSIIYIGIAAAVVFFIAFILSSVSLKRAYRKDVEIKAYFCHAPEDAERYKVPEINTSIAKNPQIIPADKIGEDVQVLIYLATDITLNKPEWNECLALARKKNLFVIPIKTESIEWPDMAKLELNRDLGVEYKSENFNGVIADIVKFLKNYQNDFTKLRNELEKSSTTFINLLTFKIDVSEEQIYKIVPHLIGTKVISGIFTADKKQFLSVKEAQKRIQAVAKVVKDQNLSQLAKIVGLDLEGIPRIVEFLQQQTSPTTPSKMNQEVAK
jgi:hypothetical protein